MSWLHVAASNSVLIGPRLKRRVLAWLSTSVKTAVSQSQGIHRTQWIVYIPIGSCSAFKTDRIWTEVLSYLRIIVTVEVIMQAALCVIPLPLETDRKCNFICSFRFYFAPSAELR